MKKRILPRLRDPCKTCLVLSICGDKCEDKKIYEGKLRRIDDKWEIIMLIGACSLLIVALPIFAITYVLMKLLYREKIGAI